MSTLWNGAVTVNEERLSGWKRHLTAQMDAIRAAISQWQEGVCEEEDHSCFPNSRFLPVPPAEDDAIHRLEFASVGM